MENEQSSSTNKKFLFGIVAIVAFVALGYFIVSSNNSSNSSGQNASEQTNTNQNPELAKRYVQFSQESLANATVNNGKAVIFFAAFKWCPTCQAADRDFKANFDKLPKDVSILIADYDSATELKNKYGVTIQDTFIQVDSQGKEITRWNSGGQGVGALLANLK